MSATTYLQHVEEMLVQTGGTFEQPPVAFVIDDEDAQFQARLRFPSGHLLSVWLTVQMTPGFPLWVYYSFHMQDASERRIFRYDNAPHWHGLDNFPHHKHLPGDRPPIATEQPSLRRIVNEVLEVVAL